MGQKVTVVMGMVEVVMGVLPNLQVMTSEEPPAAVQITSNIFSSENNTRTITFTMPDKPVYIEIDENSSGSSSHGIKVENRSSSARYVISGKKSGSITDDSSVLSGDLITLEITVTSPATRPRVTATGITLTEPIVSSAEDSGTKTYTYTFTMPDANVTITITDENSGSSNP